MVCLYESYIEFFRKSISSKRGDRGDDNMKKISLILLSTVFVFLFVSCNACNDKGSVRKFTENIENNKNTKKTKKAMMGGVSSNSNKLSEKRVHFDWKVPDAWIIGKNSSAIRVATFIIKEGEEEAVCTIIPLLGSGGGLIPNVKLWLEQVGIKMSQEDKQFKNFLEKNEKFKTKDNLDVRMIDITILQKDNDENSIIVSIITLEHKTVFIKLRGKRAVLIKNRDKFRDLCKSFKVNS